MLQRSVVDNLFAVRSLVQGRDGLFPDQTRLEATARIRCAALALRSDSVKRAAAALSGGNQQKVVLAKWLEAHPTLILLDDPTRGVDLGAKREIHDLIRRLAGDGCVVLMHVSDPDELVTVCSRVHVFVDGALNAALTGDELTEHALVSAMNQPRGPGYSAAARAGAVSLAT
jgi:ribose transport system ATP-binding protein